MSASLCGITCLGFRIHLLLKKINDPEFKHCNGRPSAGSYIVDFAIEEITEERWRDFTHFSSYQPAGPIWLQSL